MHASEALNQSALSAKKIAKLYELQLQRLD